MAASLTHKLRLATFVRRIRFWGQTWRSIRRSWMRLTKCRLGMGTHWALNCFSFLLVQNLYRSSVRGISPSTKGRDSTPSPRRGSKRAPKIKKKNISGPNTSSVIHVSGARIRAVNEPSRKFTKPRPLPARAFSLLKVHTTFYTSIY